MNSILRLFETDRLLDTGRAACENSMGRLWPRCKIPVVEQNMRIEPLGDKVVIKRLEAEQQTAGGIVLPDSAQEKPQQGRVLSVGDGRQLPDGTRSAHQVSEGDRVLFASYAGTEVGVDEETVLIMDEDDILAIIE